jgi:hypothetical protein
VKYPRIPYKATGVTTEICMLPMSDKKAEVPVFDYPITPVENFRLAAERKTPVWVPSALNDFQMCSHRLLFSEKLEDKKAGNIKPRAPLSDHQTMTDWFGVSWTFIQTVGGAMVTPGTHRLKDITKWETEVQFPVFDEYDWRDKAEAFLRNTYVPGKVLNMNFGQGVTEGLIALLGGYTEGMLAFAEEPDAVKAFLNKFADHTIEMFDLLYEVLPIHMVSYHDDWGTEKDTFFSERMMEDIVFAPTKRIIDHIHSKGVAFQHHCCGNITRFLPYMVDMHTDFLQIQRRAVDIPAMKRKYGDKIGFNTNIEGLVQGVNYTKAEVLAQVRKTVDLYCKNGGFFCSFFEMEPELMWDAACEFYAYSREFYDSERDALLTHEQPAPLPR